MLSFCYGAVIGIFLAFCIYRMYLAYVNYKIAQSQHVFSERFNQAIARECYMAGIDIPPIPDGSRFFVDLKTEDLLWRPNPDDTEEEYFLGKIHDITGAARRLVELALQANLSQDSEREG